jgi:hypothetical protein
VSGVSGPAGPDTQESMTKLPPPFILEPDIVQPDEVREDEVSDETPFDPEPLDDDGD